MNRAGYRLDCTAIGRDCCLLCPKNTLPCGLFLSEGHSLSPQPCSSRPVGILGADTCPSGFWNRCAPAGTVLPAGSDSPVLPNASKKALRPEGHLSTTQGHQLPDSECLSVFRTVLREVPSRPRAEQESRSGQDLGKGGETEKSREGAGGKGPSHLKCTRCGLA